MDGKILKVPPKQTMQVKTLKDISQLWTGNNLKIKKHPIMEEWLTAQALKAASLVHAMLCHF